MRLMIVGLGVQGTKRMGVAGGDVVATVDPMEGRGRYRTIEQVPLDSFDAACVCTPDASKLGILRYLLSRGKHVLVEKPLLAPDDESIRNLRDIARSTGACCYTAYNHRFEPHLVRLKTMLDDRILGEVYLVRLFYGNGTAREVRQSPWRDQGLGVLPDLGSHLLDLVLFFFGALPGPFEHWALNRFENQAFDHALFGSSAGKPAIELECTLVSWRNTFTVDVFGELGSAHVHGLCKWGPSTLTIRRRVLPSGIPDEQVQSIEQPDPTWAAEYVRFTELCGTSGGNLENDVWINSTLHAVSEARDEELKA